MNEINCENFTSTGFTCDQVKELLISELRIAKAELLYEENVAHSYFDRQLVEERIFFIQKLMRKLNIKDDEAAY